MRDQTNLHTRWRQQVSSGHRWIVSWTRAKFSGADVTLNSGAEWRGVAVPRASFGHTLPQNSTQAERRQGDVGGKGRQRREDRQGN